MIASCVKGMQHLGLPTANMEKTLAFYGALGFEKEYETVNDGARVVFLRLAGLCVEAYESAAAVGSPGAIDHIALDVDDVERTLVAVRAAGLEPVEAEIQFLPFFERGVRFFNVMGPNGEKLEFNQIL